MEDEKTIIVGAGLCGSLLGCYLAGHGRETFTFEKRGDLRKSEAERGRSINLALSARGIKALGLAGINEEIRAVSIPMPARGIHMPDGSFQLYPYSGRSGEYINSISRTDLNALLMDRYEQLSGTKIQFKTSCESVNFEANEISLKSTDTGQYSTTKYANLFGTDGAASAIRTALYSRHYASYYYQQDFLDYGYKELILPAGSKEVFKLEKNALHIWPRGHFMMIALPNLDGSFTVTLFLPLQGKDSFDEIDKSTGIKSYFDSHFKGIAPLFDDLDEQYSHNPIGMLGTIKCFPWSDGRGAMILGDAAHAIVPFYGQGMNAAFEDIFVLSQLINSDVEISPSIMDKLQNLRKPNTDAIADLAIDNFYEMRDKTGDALFQMKRNVETRLEKNFPRYYSKYSLVTFRDDIPYEEAMKRGRKQDEWLMNFLQTHTEVKDSDLASVAAELDQLKY
ncbi:MAG TPA: NAD(P)/FAD-dependent oxidoreductase [Saprospiraceae bacterium]|nr:NAD(P)/FAD-dependent oxidoreductase [Saprospiraceae bacterium]